MVGDLALFGSALEPALKRLLGGAQFPRLAPNRARHVVLPAELIQDGAANSRHGVGAEGQSARDVETLERIDQPDRAGTDHLVEVRLHRHAARHLPRDVVDETQMLGQKRIARGGITAGIPVPGCSRFHARTSAAVGTRRRGGICLGRAL